jgi:transposase InsO family protein
VRLRKEFVLKALAQDVPFRELCREFSISRKTGYKWLERFHEHGFEGLVDQSTRPEKSPGRTSGEIAVEIIRLRQAHPTWGPKKIRKLLSKRLPLEAELPSLRTISRVLTRVHLNHPKKRRRRPADQGWMLQATRKHIVVEAPNDGWTVDFKGWWTTRDGRRCEPLTVRDAFSRFILALRILPRSDTDGVRAVFEELFERHGLPKAIQSDNGAPFAAGRSLAGLTKLSAWWITLGIDVVRSRPGCPQDNGAHERMHADISIELQTQSAQSIRAQQRACDDWRTEFNHIRPHEALALETPADVYRSSPRRLMRARIGGFPDDTEIVKLGPYGKFWLDGRHHVFVSSSLGGMQIALQRMADGLVRVWFYHLLIGQFRVGLGIGRNVQVQPLPPPETNAKGGDTRGDTDGDTPRLSSTEVSPLGASAWPGAAPERASGGDTPAGAPTGQPSPMEKEELAELQNQVA